MSHHNVIIVGAGHAGAQAAIALRQASFAGTIALIGEEPDLPYERPALSKDYLAGDKPFERMLIRPAKFWADRAVEMITGVQIVRVDPHARGLTSADGRTFGYDHLIWAAGGKPRQLACRGADLAGVHAVRSRVDVDSLLAELPTAQQVVVVGGGYIGLEAAAVLRKLGKAVTVVESAPRVLSRVAGEPLSRFFEDEHRAQGVTFRLGASVECIEGDIRATGIRLAGGDILHADLVIVGIGIDPSVAPLAAASARTGNGVEVDAQCRTSLPGIFAVGDCALHHNRFAGGTMVRLESIQNANDQATVAAKTIAGQDAAYDSLPWFWSNQYDLKLQTAGLARDYDTTEIEGDPTTRSFAVRYLRGGKLVAIDCVNFAKAYVRGRAEVTQTFA
jgi:3-phenylpropionate/trans-cinnamate dioxygenase ferredoxin reductase component